MPTTQKPSSSWEVTPRLAVDPGILFPAIVHNVRTCKSVPRCLYMWICVHVLKKKKKNLFYTCLVSYLMQGKETSHLPTTVVYTRKGLRLSTCSFLTHRKQESNVMFVIRVMIMTSDNLLGHSVRTTIIAHHFRFGEEKKGKKPRNKNSVNFFFSFCFGFYFLFYFIFFVIKISISNTRSVPPFWRSRALAVWPRNILLELVLHPISNQTKQDSCREDLRWPSDLQPGLEFCDSGVLSADPQRGGNMCAKLSLICARV